MLDLEEFKQELGRLKGCCMKHPQDYQAELVAGVELWVPSVPDEATGYALFTLKDGRFGTLVESQDFTGHGCQCDSSVEFFSTRDEAIRLGIGESGCVTLGIEMPNKEFSVNEAEYQGRIRDLTAERDKWKSIAQQYGGHALEEIHRIQAMMGGLCEVHKKQPGNEQKLPCGFCAVKRIGDLEQIILRLRACYKWDREEYQSNRELVADVEKAMAGVRMREGKSP